MEGDMGGVAREPMTEVNVTPEEMEKRIARFADMVPYKDTLNAAHGIPPEAMQMMSSDKVFPLMCPADWEGRSKSAAVRGAPGLTVTIAECPAGRLVGTTQAHRNTVENFFCVEGNLRDFVGRKC